MHANSNCQCSLSFRCGSKLLTEKNGYNCEGGQFLILYDLFTCDIESLCLPYTARILDANTVISDMWAQLIHIQINMNRH